MEAMSRSTVSGRDTGLKLYHELMANKVGDILLVSCPYDAFIMEEEGHLSARIINEYKGLNLSKPPRLTWVSSASEALARLEKKKYDLILAMPSLYGMDVHAFAAKVKQQYADLPFFMLLHKTFETESVIDDNASALIDRTYIWRGNADLLLAIIKAFEDEKNVAFDTATARVRVIILVEDSPYHYSSFLPVLYKQIVMQTQSLIDESMNEDQRLLKMRGRPKVLVAHNYEEAMLLYETYRPYLMSVFSDMRYTRQGVEDDLAGYRLLDRIKKDNPDLPVLILSTEEQNREKAGEIPAAFINKNSGTLNDQIRHFFLSDLGFGPFVFKLPTGDEIARVSDLRGIERIMPDIPDESILYHAMNNDFSRWFMARGEIEFALKIKPYEIDDFPEPGGMKTFLLESIRARRKWSRQGQIIDFDSEVFDTDVDFMKTGGGSLGGKARGIAFMASQIRKDTSLQEKFPDVDIHIPQTFVISTEGFRTFIETNRLSRILDTADEMEDAEIVQRFVQAEFPEGLRKNLETYLENVNYPIAVRSSSLFEDAHYQPFAGLYKTYMLPNSHPDLEVRLERLIMAVKRVYASTYLKAPRSYARSTMHRTEDEDMAVIIQQLTGTVHGRYFYPSISGVAQSYNFYPIGHLKAEDGIAHIALGFGRIVMEGGQTLRFCPKYPRFLPQFSIVKDILENSQKGFYALKLDDFPKEAAFLNGPMDDPCLTVLDVAEAADHPVVRSLCSTYDLQDHRIRDSFSRKGYPILTFAGILKYPSFPLAALLDEVTKVGRHWMGTSVEIEFAVTLPGGGRQKPRFSILQIRPMGRYKQNMEVEIGPEQIKSAFCHSTLSLGNGEYKDIRDVVVVDPETFDPSRTLDIVSEINRINAGFNPTREKYVLIGPGRWGSSDPWLGIPVAWNDISNVGVMVETTVESIRADPSQGSHFFQNITSLGISYISISGKGEDFLDYEFLNTRPCECRTRFLKHIRFQHPIRVLVDGKTSRAVLISRPEGDPETVAAEDPLKRP